MLNMNLEKIYTSPCRSFNFQQLFFYDIFCAIRGIGMTFYEVSVVKVYVYTTVLDRHKIEDSGHLNK